MSLISTLKSWLGLSSTPGKMSPGDRLLVCADCNENFVFDEGEQKFFKEKGFTDPKRCPHCRKKIKSRIRRRHRGGGGGGGGHSQNNNRHHSRGGGGRHYRNSLIDGKSPYADER